MKEQLLAVNIQTDLQTKLHVLVTSAHTNNNRHLMALSKEIISFAVFSSSASGTFSPCKRPSNGLHSPFTAVHSQASGVHMCHKTAIGLYRSATLFGTYPLDGSTAQYTCLL